MNTARQGPKTAPAAEVHELGAGFYAYVQPDGSWGLNNCGIYVGDTDVALIDTVFTERRAYALAASITELTDKPVRTIVNTHHHGDHVYGNFVFPQAQTIGQQRCRDAVIATDMETTMWFPGVDFGNITLVPPRTTFEDRLTLYWDRYRVELRATDVPAHTDNDVTVWVEDLGLLFAGDLVFHGGTPFVLMGSIEGLKRTLSELAEYEIATLVPGHGPLCGVEVIHQQLDYLDFVQELARSSFHDETTPLEAARAADLGPFAAWTDRERLVGNLHRAYSELRGEPLGIPLDYGAIVEEMVAYNDGQPLRSLA